MADAQNAPLQCYSCGPDVERLIIVEEAWMVLRRLESREADRKTRLLFKGDEMHFMRDVLVLEGPCLYLLI
jgi:hypothetical protein